MIASIDGGIGGYAIASDAKRIAFFGTLNGTPERSYSQPDLWVIDAPGGSPRNLTASYDFDAGGSLGGDQRAPRGTHPSAAGMEPAMDGRSSCARGSRACRYGARRCSDRESDRTPLPGASTT